MYKNQKVLLILLTAINLRLSITAVTPIFSSIQNALKVGSSITALLVTIPLLCFSIGAVITTWLNRTISLKSLLLTSTGLLTIANLTRPYNVTILLFSTVIIGMAIALLNVLIPIMITQVSTDSTTVTRLTSYYAVTMNVGGSLGAAVAIPLTHILGWANVMRGFAIPAILTFIVALLVRSLSTRDTDDTSHDGILKTLITDKTAQVLTLFMGLQSLIYYSLITWLPAIYQSLGASADEAGILLSVFQFIGIPAALMMNFITNKKLLFGILASGYLLGISFLMVSHFGWWISAIILGFTASLIFSVALNLISNSSTDINKIANRSALAQSLGYLLAAIGPFVFGRLFDNFKTWNITLIIIAILMGSTIIIGLKITNKKEKI
ncbi:MFS transporter [Companilactobacillus keshanensis]|uniref:MFS transporter n=1 Tax=Companilactobacillus keshanensis TaxID=2486003 RepID=A0ABW4BSD0_9LACO|nr:MFS transporter [Companilactobacillus keshanensis]